MKHKPENRSGRTNGLTYPSATIEQKLGMNGVRAHIKNQCITPAASEMIDSMKFTTDFSIIVNDLNCAEEMRILLENENAPNLTGIVDIREELVTLATKGTFLEVPTLAGLKRSMSVAMEIVAFFREECDSPTLTELTSRISDLNEEINIIDAILTPQGTIRDNASTELQQIRSRMATIQSRISSAMRRVLTRAVNDGIVEADTQPVMRDGHFVVPVVAMNKRRLSGIVHDESASGRTYFIEPSEIVELSNEQRELLIEERREIVRILIDTADRLRPRLGSITESLSIVYQLDFIRAKGLFALQTGGHLPEMHDKCIIQWHDAVHPLLKLNLEARSRTVVPLDLELTSDTARILIVSGPNAGGKSVTLKTVGLNQYMIQCGVLPIMDGRSRAGIFDAIFVDIGDDQSIDDDLSTYSSHLRNMKYMLSHGTDRSLFLIDEFGGGTEPQIGGALAQALLAEFNDKGMWGVVTTHYQNLKQFAQETQGIVNGSMLYDRARMAPTFRLATGNPGSSFAVDIALRTGLPRRIIEKAEEIVGSDYFNVDRYLLEIARDRRYWESKRAEIKEREKQLDKIIERYETNADNLRQQRRAIIEDAKNEAESIIARSNAAVERTIREIRSNQADKEKTRAARTRLDEERKDIASQRIPEHKELKKVPSSRKKKEVPKQQKSERQIIAGDTVLLDNKGVPGIVSEVKKKTAIVNFGQMKMEVPTDRLTHTIRKPASGATGGTSVITSETSDAIRDRQLGFRNEIDVRGMRADEALQAVTYFIDDAIQFNAGRVRILHGTGTGALRVAIRHYLSTVSGVTSFRDEDVRFGGAGITVVELS